MRRMLDLLAKPMVEDFVYLSALRMSQTEVLAGAAACTRVVIASYSDALSSGDVTPLRELNEAGSLDLRLYNHLAEEVLRGQEDGKVSSIAKQMRYIEQAAPCVESTLLVIGCQRTGFNGFGRHRLDFGSNVVVVGEPFAGGKWLWWPGVQQELLRKYGCSVQVQIKFHVMGGSPQRYTFEAPVSRDQLRGEDMFTVPVKPPDCCEPPDLEFTLVDLNACLDSNQFWTTAKEVQTFLS